MAHHGNGHARYNRSMRKRYQSDEGGNGGADKESNAMALPTRISQEPVVYAVRNELVIDEEGRSQQAQDSRQISHIKRQEPNASTDDQTTVVATVANVEESGSQTTGLSTSETPSATSDQSTQASTSGLSAESGSVTAPTSATGPAGEHSTASPAYSSPTADTPTVTTASDPSTSVPPSGPNSSKTSTPLFGTTSTHLPASSTPIRPTSTSTNPNATSTRSSSSITTSSSSVGYVGGNQSGTTTSYDSFATATTSLSWSDTSSNAGAWGTTTNGAGGGAGATATGQSPAATTAAAASGGLSTQTKGKIAGGVVGGVAAAMVFVVLLWLLLRRRKRAIRPQARDALPAADMAGTATTEGSITRSAEMTSRRSSNDPLFTASYFAPAFMQRWRQSHMTTRTTDSVCSDSSERGFQKISGRKIPSVLHSGGDGYGGGAEQTSPTVSEPSSTFAAPGSPVIPRSPPSQPPLTTPYGMPLDTSYTREAEEPLPVVKFRPSPARTPVTGSANASLHNEPSAPRMIPSVHVQVSGALSPTMPKRPDALGRSHPSFDGSRGSRFTESI
ncbi:uncharacterized protein BO97DRAFT_210148 [Aspergillus homomorphus CBS 101889]|uniref:Mid2 domain-containing protein n=1 Tax=Aspergillus homomorphus (strain CBS 101889) TaxID=1450537 RepID=A0A395I7Z2_ASPHC|nr:hypothetical protein BO97DRAFT_210148 [Aspergillus homomorphus CBS 101889]RAL15373.1 hypothetical protein BO97DRAFT_210148 [Aspergillus homomorphus CBS 101889]